MSRSRNKGSRRCIACLGRNSARKRRDRSWNEADGRVLPRGTGKHVNDDPYLGECAKNICARH